MYPQTCDSLTERDEANAHSKHNHSINDLYFVHISQNFIPLN